MTGARRNIDVARRAWAALIFLLAFQCGVYCALVLIARTPPKTPECVLVYTGEGPRIQEAVRLAVATRAPRLFITRTNLQEVRYFRLREKAGSAVKVDFDMQALTTDGNARAAASYLRQQGVRRAVLVTSWRHMPRAYLLTRLYLAGSGVQLRPSNATPLPKAFFLDGGFWMEYLKLWGSLYRVALHLFSAK